MVRHVLDVLASMCLMSVLLVNFNDSVRGELTPTDFSPARNAVSAPVDSSILLNFDLPLDPATIGPTSVSVFGRSSGPVSGNWQLANSDRTLIVQPASPFSAGELVTVQISNQLAAVGGDRLRPGGFAYQFYTQTQSDQPFALRIPPVSGSTGAGTVPYGGVANDFNRDGWLDIAVINEGIGDLRVFPNHADGSGTFADHLPPTPLRTGASPSEVQDFNRDGLVDLAVSNSDGTVSVVLGQGDGTFAPQQVVPVTSSGIQHGLATLDVDGDGDADLVRSSPLSPGHSLSLLLNDGNGIFGPASSLGLGGGGLAAGDLNNDGLIDLVTGRGAIGTSSVYLSNGDGSFSLPNGAPLLLTNVPQIALGDLNGDGNLDVTAPNRFYLGNGDGTFSDAMSPAVIGVTATDLGDLDGDGDLDWIVSGPHLRVNINDGLAGFTSGPGVPQAFQEADCALLLDSDNDGDLDVTSFVERVSRMRLFHNLSVIPEPVTSCYWSSLVLYGMLRGGKRGGGKRGQAHISDGMAKLFFGRP